MPAGNFDLEKLLSPLSTDQFFSQYWQKKHCFLPRRDSDYFEQLMTRSDLENIISNSDMRYPAIRLAKGGGYFPPEAYTHNMRYGDESFTAVPDVQQISAQYRAGATVALPAIHRIWTPLGLLCDSLQRQLDHAAHANVYITPGNAAGFTPHYDVHEVFVLQIAGKKLWSIYQPSIHLPHRSQPFTPHGYSAPAPMEQVELNAGDSLYLPRGYIHSTSTSDSYSAHVTIGIGVYTWVDLAKEFLASAIENPALREALPPGFASRADLKPALRQKLMDVVDQMRAGADPDKLIDAFTSRVRSAHAPRREPFRADATVIDEKSRLQVPPPASYAVTQEGERTVLEFKGVRYQVPPPMVCALSAMCVKSTFRPAELPDHLDMDGRLGFSRHLHDIGFLTLVA